VMVLSLVTNLVVVSPSYKSIREEVEAEVHVFANNSFELRLTCMDSQLAGRPMIARDAQVVSHEEVLAVGSEKAEVMKSLVQRVVELLS
jgi:purine-nucleoside phosphorylase